MLKRQRLAEGTGSWNWIGTVILSDDIGDAPTFEEHAQLVQTNLDLIAILETERVVIDKVILGGVFAHRVVADALRDIYPNVHFEVKQREQAQHLLETDFREFQVA